MIYNNLFKPNRASKSKTTLYYLIESRKYKFSFIFDRKSISILSGLTLGLVIILGANVLFYGILNTNSASKIKDLEDVNSQYESSISSISGMQSNFDEIQKSVESIYNISDKSTKWSNIIESIAFHLPYDSVLTSIESITEEELNEVLDSITNEVSSGEIEEENKDEGEDEDVPSDEEEPLEDNTEEEVDEEDYDNIINKDLSNLNNKNIVLITGKSLSMVNLSLFLDKLDGLHIFSKVENLTSIRNYTNGYYDFVIYATIR